MSKKTLKDLLNKNAYFEKMEINIVYHPTSGKFKVDVDPAHPDFACFALAIVSASLIANNAKYREEPIDFIKKLFITEVNASIDRNENGDTDIKSKIVPKK